MGGVRFVTAVDGSGVPTKYTQFDSTTAAWAYVSDEAAKENFTPVDQESALRCLAGMHVWSWTYKSDGSNTRHVGPTAQEFSLCFGRGEDRTMIDSGDINGVNLMLAQALEKKTRTLEAQNQALRASNEALAANNQRLEQRLAAIERALQKGGIQ